MGIDASSPLFIFPFLNQNGAFALRTNILSKKTETFAITIEF